jgi:acyl-homoserine lactone acylase PvdQ
MLAPLSIDCQSVASSELQRWEQQAKQVTIIRDNMGIPHIYGKTDANVVFGLMYAQCEDDFNRVEMNYIEKLGRMAEVTGKDYVYNDLLIKMIIDTSEAIKDFNRSPEWLKKLCYAFSDGINYYLYKHPEKKPALLTTFKPWFPLLWTDGSIGAISTSDVTLRELENFYSTEPSLSFNHDQPSDLFEEDVATGSNGFAFSPKITESGHSILYINPHVTFYFRPEVHMISEEGLNAYGAVTWGQFFIYQGFNEHCGWMHTSSGVDAADTYIEKVHKKDDKWYYTYDGKSKPIISKQITVHVRKGNNVDKTPFNVLFTHHGPIMAKRNGSWLSVKADNRLLNGLIQCWQRTKAKGLEDFKKTLELKGNISNNTVYADAQGNIAYWHGNRIPVRDKNYDWSKPVDGSTSATEWSGYHPIDETVMSINPPNGWLQNCNSTPFTSAGEDSPLKGKFPHYMAPDGENFRGINAVRVLKEENKYNLDKVIKAGYDTRMAAFEVLVPALVKAFDSHINYQDTLFAWLAGPIEVLRHWDYKSSENSVATTLAIEWGQKLLPKIKQLNTLDADDEGNDQVKKVKHFAANDIPGALLSPFLSVIHELDAKFGQWQMPWGSINRFQRISADIEHRFDDSKFSYPVGFASSTWGMLPSYTSQTFAGTQKRYGINGNSFVCAVEFGKKISAKALLAGGNSGNENSQHFFDQGEMYSKGRFRDVLFYKEDVISHAERTYFPGE